MHTQTRKLPKSKDLYKPFLALAFTALLSTSLLAGCNNNSSTIESEFSPRPAKPITAHTRRTFCEYLAQENSKNQSKCNTVISSGGLGATGGSIARLPGQTQSPNNASQHRAPLPTGNQEVSSQFDDLGDQWKHLQGLENASRTSAFQQSFQDRERLFVYGLGQSLGKIDRANLNPIQASAYNDLEKMLNDPLNAINQANLRRMMEKVPDLAHSLQRNPEDFFKRFNQVIRHAL